MNKNLLDVSNIFQHYITFGGDVAKTAVALNLDPQDVRDLARVEKWSDKVEAWNQIRQGDSQDVQVQVNRAINFVQSHRMRSILDKIVSHLSTKDAEALVELLTTHGKNGSSFSARPLTDLVKGLEACQLMTQRALGDTAAERPDASKSVKGSSIALLVMNAMNAADSFGLDSAGVVKQQLTNPTHEEARQIPPVNGQP
jgi:hypothetical protein